MANHQPSRDNDENVSTTTIGLINRQTFSAGPRWATIGIFFILLFGALYLAASFVLPVVLSILFALVMSPIVRFMRRRLHVYEPISALILVVGATLTLIAGFYMLSGPISSILSDMPRYVHAVDRELQGIQSRFSEIEAVQDSVTSGEQPTAPSADNANPVASGSASSSQAQQQQPAEVVVRSPGLLNTATTQIPAIAAQIAFSLIFLFFLLASGDLFYQKIVRAMPTLSDKKRALQIGHQIERELSRYLFTITLINCCLGIAVGTGLWWVDMPTPIVFGALATLLNFVPYLGSLFGMAIVGVVALAEFGNLSDALVPVLIYLACTSLEGQLITPTVVGRRLEMNAAAVFLSVAFWGWIWGVPGLVLAVPMMVTFKVFASYIPPLQYFGDFLSAEPRAVRNDGE